MIPCIFQPTETYVETSLISAICRLFWRDRALLESNIHEVAITHKLACYLQDMFAYLDVDCEYNKHEENPKRVNQDEPKSIRPDIVVHRRKRDDCNLLVIEVKKIGTRQRNIDPDKLKALTDQNGNFKYKYGVGLKLYKNKDKDICPCIQVYEGGEISKEKTCKWQKDLKKIWEIFFKAYTES